MNEGFNTTLSDVSQFYMTDDCVGCGLCSQVYNGQTINYQDGKSVWGGINVQNALYAYIIVLQEPYNMEKSHNQQENIEIQILK